MNSASEPTPAAAARTAWPRSYLFVPGDRPERFAKALASGADAVVLDLEDAVAPAAKPAARAAVAQALAAWHEDQRRRCIVRINEPGSAWFEQDLAALTEAGVTALMWPKAESAAAWAEVHRRWPALALLPLIETARGLQAVEALAAAPGVQRLVFGTIDFALDMGLAGPLAGSLGLDAAAARIALAARLAGLPPPVAGVTPAITDDAALQAELQRAMAHGFGAKLCIHPRQVAAVHALLAPSAEELAWAGRVMAALEQAGSAAGALQVDGRMVDKPLIERARRWLQAAA